ncbi:SDR family NAD(P)-dependent oxidoreductase [Pirellulales bacterium]|nr:SDR family NAD(P)-dependent oxidoreductase [Pirellulales bacterium]
MPRQTNQRLALITGGGGALGRAAAAVLGRSGAWHVVLADIDAAAAETAASDLKSQGVSAEYLQLDVTDEATWREVCRQLRGRWQQLDLLMNAAGVCGAGDTATQDLDDLRRIVDTNFWGALHGCRATIPWMKERGCGTILNVASISGLIALPGMAAYAASKAAIVALSESLYAELRPLGVGVTVAAPGFFPSQLIPHGVFASDELRKMADRLAQASTITADTVAEQALRGALRGDLYVVTGGRARRFWRLKRLAPTWLARRVAARYGAMLELAAARQK